MMIYSLFCLHSSPFNNVLCIAHEGRICIINFELVCDNCVIWLVKNDNLLFVLWHVATQHTE